MNVGADAQFDHVSRFLPTVIRMRDNSGFDRWVRLFCAFNNGTCCYHFVSLIASVSDNNGLVVQNSCHAKVRYLYMIIAFAVAKTEILDVRACPACKHEANMRGNEVRVTLKKTLQ